MMFGENNKKCCTFETKLNAVAFLADMYEGRTFPDADSHLKETIVLSLKALLRDLDEFSQRLSEKLGKEEGTSQKSEQVVEQPKRVVSEVVEQPKRRGRSSKKKEEPVVEEPAPVEEKQPSRHREIDFECGLEKGLAAYSNIDGVTDDSIVNEKLGPIPLANSLPKQGEHPFFKGPAQFVWYLDMERWPMYLANLLDDKNFYPDQLSLYDAKRFEEARKVGVDIEFVTALVDKETKRMVSIDDFKEADYADDEKGMEALLELKESGFLKKFVAEVDPEKKLLKFLTRFGQNKHIAEDLQTIYEEHTEHPNKYIHW